MGNIFSYCWKVKDNFSEMKDSYLLKPLNKDDESPCNEYSYASFVDGDGDRDIVLENLNMLHKKIEILEDTTQSSLKNISLDIKHIYGEQEEIKKHINSPNSSTYSNRSKSSVNEININSSNSSDEITEPLKYEITEPLKYEITEPLNQSSMFVNESVYHDTENSLKNNMNDLDNDITNNESSEEETY